METWDGAFATKAAVGITLAHVGIASIVTGLARRERRWGFRVLVLVAAVAGRRLTILP